MLSPADSGAWQRTSRVAIVIFFGRAAKWVYDRYGAFGQVVAAAGITALLVRNPQYTVLAVVVALLTVTVAGALQYWFFRFRIDADRILVRHGVVKRTALDLPFDRIQGINVNRRPLERALGLVTVVLDTPGSIAAEAELPAVDPGIAERLIAEVAEHQDGAPTESEETDPAAAGRPGRKERKRTLLQQLSLSEVLRMGVASPGVMLYAALLLVVGRQVDLAVDSVAEAFEFVAVATGGAGALAATLAAVVLVFGLLVLALVGRIVRAVIRYNGYTLWHEGSSYRSQAGLLTRKEVAVGVRKVQQLRTHQRLMYRFFRRYRIEAPTIGMSLDGEDDEGVARGAVDAEVLRIPWADRGLVERVRSGVFPGEGEGLALLPGDKAFTRVSRLYVRAVAMRFLFVGLPVGIVLLFVVSYVVSRSWRGADIETEVLLMRFLEGWGIASVGWGIFCLATAVPIGLLRWRNMAYMHDGDGLSRRSGIFGFVVKACLFRKAQGVTVERSPLQRRHGLATLEVETACGSLVVPYIEHATACALRDHIVYRMESSNRRWH